MSHQGVKVEDFDNIDQNKKQIYIGEQGLPRVLPYLPSSATRTVELGLVRTEGCGEGMTFTIVMDVTHYEFAIAERGEGSDNPRVGEGEHETWTLSLGDRATLAGYTFRVVAGDCFSIPSDGPQRSSVAVILEEIPDDVVFAADADPNFW